MNISEKSNIDKDNANDNLVWKVTFSDGKTYYPISLRRQASTDTQIVRKLVSMSVAKSSEERRKDKKDTDTVWTKIKNLGKEKALNSMSAELIKVFSSEDRQDAKDLKKELTNKDRNSLDKSSASSGRLDQKKRSSRGSNKAEKEKTFKPQSDSPIKKAEKTPEEIAAQKTQDKNYNLGSLKTRISDLKAKIEKYSTDRSMKSYIPKMQQQLDDAQAEYEKLKAQNEAKQHLQEVARFKKIAGILHS